MSTLSSVIIEGLASAMPTASIPGRTYYTTDTKQIFYDNGTSWDDVTPTTGAPSGAANLVYATPNGTSGVASLRSIVAADVPTLNQNTTGTAANATLAANSTAVGGIAVTGTPTVGQILTATSGTAANWQHTSSKIANFNTNALPAVSSSAFAFKGALLQMQQNVSISAVWAYLSPTAAQTYVAAIASVSGITGSPAINSIPTISPAITIPTLPTFNNNNFVWVRVPFSSPVALIANSMYVVSIGLTSGTGTTVCPVSSPVATTDAIHDSFPAYIGSLARMSDNPPVNGTAIDTGGNAVVGTHLGIEWF